MRRVDSALLPEQALHIGEFLFNLAFYSIPSHFSTLIIITDLSHLLQLGFKS